MNEANIEQQRAWNGEQGDFWVSYADRFEAGVAGYLDGFLDAAALAEGETVLDVGCGPGQTTREAARRVRSGSALGIDLSAPLLRLARERALAERLGNATFVEADAQVHAFPEERFDVVLSRNGAMFFDDPPKAFANLAAATRSGGRLVLQVWQSREDNEFLSGVEAALGLGKPSSPAPFSLSVPRNARNLLREAGFSDIAVDGVTADMYLGSDVEDAFAFVTRQRAAAIGTLDDAVRDTALDRLRADLAAHVKDDGVYYGSAAWFVTARRP